MIHADIIYRLLRLLYRHLCELVLARPCIADAQLGKATVTDPFVEEAVPGPPGEFFDNRNEILGNHALQRVALHESPDTFAIELFAQLRTKHVQHPAAFLITAIVKLIIRRFIQLMDDGPLLLGPRRYPSRRPVEVIEKTISSVLMIFIQLLVVYRKAFVQPQMRPVLAGNVVSEPLVNQFMGDETGAGMNVLRLGGKERSLGQYGKGGVFHAACDKVLDGNLIILVPGILHADFLLKEGHHIGGVSKRILG